MTGTRTSDAKVAPATRRSQVQRPNHYTTELRVCNRKSVCLLSLCRRRLSVTFVHPTQPVEIFQCFCANLYPIHPSVDILAKFYGDPPRELLRRGLNARGLAKYSDVGHVEGCISETVQDTASDTIND